ncbi:hypothetical protein GBAR_LOCUS18767, partial [Geodia barretti]
CCSVVCWAELSSGLGRGPDARDLSCDPAGIPTPRREAKCHVRRMDVAVWVRPLIGRYMQWSSLTGIWIESN